MWILECEDETLENKRIWLRPGKKYLFGRTKWPKGRDAGFYIKDHTVSRKQITICVSEVKRGDGSLVHTGSKLEIKDEGKGTVVDGVKISGETRILKNDAEHTFEFGKTTGLFRIKWQPAVLSFSFSTKDIKGGKDPLAAVRNRLEELDIKAILPYIIDKTTHVVSSKRNTAKGLQAIINAKYIVAESFVDALVYATTPCNLDEPESLSPLEEDFDANWPNALNHLPAKGKEPNERPVEFFTPDPTRINIFEGYTFIFCDQVQYETLQAPVFNGGGKAVYQPLEPGKTTARELIRVVKKVAGEKSLGEFEDGSSGKGVVLVRFRGKKEFQDWAMDLGDQLALALDQRMIEQNEFMDAILTNNASMLRRPLQEEDESEPAPPHTMPEGSNRRSVEETSQQDSAQPPPKRSRRRGPIVSRFKGFDDEEEEDTPMSVSLRTQYEGTQIQNKYSSERSQRILSSTSLPNSAIEVDPQEPESINIQAQNPRKRAAPQSDDDNDEEMVERLLPAAAAMKRRRIEEQEEAHRKGISSATSFGRSQSTAEPEKPKLPKKEVDIKEAVRERREAEENAARRDEESLRETLDGMNVSDMKNLAVVEEMPLPARTMWLQRTGLRNGDSSNLRWDEAWNGRKNFKKFRRRGDDAAYARRGQSVIVPLEEIKKKDFGIGEEHWLESEKSKRKRREKEHAAQTQEPSQIQSQQPFATARSQNTQASAAEPADDSDDEMPDEATDMDANLLPRSTTRRTDPLQGSGGRLPSAIGKRAATGGANGRPLAKKPKILILDEDSGSESDSEDELKFRFKKKG